MSGSVEVSRTNGQCLKLSCAKTGIYKIGDLVTCRSHLRQVLDKALEQAPEMTKEEKQQKEFDEHRAPFPSCVGTAGCACDRHRRLRLGLKPAKVECVCPKKPCAFCALSLKERVAQTGGCTQPDVDVSTMICGHPLPCPRHPAGNK